VRYSGVYPGIDLVYYGTPDRSIEYDLELAQGSDPSQIVYEFEGFDRVAVDEAGDLRLQQGGETITHRRPRAFQGGEEVHCQYRMLGSNRVRLELADFDPLALLTVDPVLEFSTYFGGPGLDGISDVRIDRDGFIFIAGTTQTPAAPTLNPFQQTNLIRNSPFVAKLTANADRIVFFSVLQCELGSASATRLVVDDRGSPIVLGRTLAADLPVKNPIQANYKAAFETVFVTKWTPDGRNLVYSTFFGGSRRDNAFGLTLHPSGDIFIAGHSDSSDIPIRNAFQKQNNGAADCFLARIGTAGDLKFSTYFGASEIEYCGSIALDGKGSVYLTGESRSEDPVLKDPIQTVRTARGGFPTAMLARFSDDNGDLQYATLIGGPGSASLGRIGINSKGEIIAGGVAYDNLFSVPREGAFEERCETQTCGLIMRLDPAGRTILAMTFFGGGGFSTQSDLQVAPDDSVYLTGWAGTPDFPAKNSLQPFRGGGSTQSDYFLARFSPDLRSLIFSTFFGGTNVEAFQPRLGFDSIGRVYLAGATTSSDFPNRNAFQSNFAGQYDGILARFSDATPVVDNPVVVSPGRVSLRFVQGVGSGVVPQRIQLSGGTEAFTASADAAWVTVNPKTGVLPASIQVGAAVLAPGTYSANITVTVQGKPPLAVPVSFSVLTPAPQVTSLEPSFVPIGSDDTTITFHGSGFAEGARLRLYEQEYSLLPTFVDAQTLTLRMPYLSFVDEGSYRFSVVNPGSEISQPIILSVGRLSPVIRRAVNAASNLQGAVGRGELIVLEGENFSPANGLQVTFSGIVAAIISSTPTRLVVLVPQQLLGDSTNLLVGSGFLQSTPLVLPVADSAPGLFTADGSGTGDVLIDGTPTPGSTITLFGTGDGGLPVAVWIDGKECVVESSGAVEGKPGWFQVLVVIPVDASIEAPVAVALKAGDRESQPGVTLTLR